MRFHWLQACALALVLVPCVLVPCVLGPAAQAEGVLGEEWEESIDRGLVRQRQEQRNTPSDALVGKYERVARREATVSNLYLLARAYGLRAADHQALSGSTAPAGEKARLGELAARDRATAERTYREVLQLAPNCYFAQHDLGVLALQSTPPDTKRAFQFFNEAYRVHPHYTPTLRQLVNLYGASKQYEAAVTLLRTILQTEPDDDEGRLRLAGLLGELQRFAEAYAEVDRLLARNRSDPRAWLTQAQMDLASGNLERAIATFRRLMSSNPTASAPYLGLLRTAQSRTEKNKNDPIALQDALDALRGLHRLERGVEPRAQLAKDIEGLERALAGPASAGTSAAPTVAQALDILKRPEEEARTQAVLYLMTRQEKPTGEEQRDMLRALSAHTTPGAEPSPQVRAVAVGAVGRLFGTAWFWVVRKALSDPDGRVVAQTADTLSGIAGRDPDAQGAAVCALGLHAEDPDVVGASACRLGVLVLLGATLGDLSPECTDAEHRAAFRAWWNSSVGQDRLVESLKSYPRAQDPHAHEVLLPYLERGDFFSGRAALDALQQTRSRVREDALKAWYARMPAVVPTELDKAAWEAALPGLLDWARAAPSR